MCRLLGIYGKVDFWREMLSAFGELAETGKVPPVEGVLPGHKDGWGIAVSNKSRTAMEIAARDMGSAADSRLFRETVENLAPPHVLICHLRKASSPIAVTPANVHDSQTVGGLLHGNETKVWGDSAYQGQKEAIREAAPKAKDMTNKRGARHKPLTEVDQSKNRTKSKVRSRVEHPFLVIKKIFGFFHVRYRGLEKNRSRFEVVCALANLYMKRHTLMRRCWA